MNDFKWPRKEELQSKDVLFLSGLLNLVSTVLDSKLQIQQYRKRRGIPEDKESARVYAD